MLEVLAGGLHRVDDVFGGKGLAMKAGDANQQSFHQRKLGRKQGELPGH